MLEFLRIQRFKTLMDANFPMASLNLFAGLNGMGKSTLIQSLLLLRQSHELNVLFNRGLLLKGKYLDLGMGQDVLAMQAEIESIEFLLKWKENVTLAMSFSYDSESDLQPVLEVNIPKKLESLSLFNQHFQYLSADRIGPKPHYELSDFHLRELNSLGTRGEYTVQFIADQGSKPLPIESLRHKNANSNSIWNNLNAWMAEISPGIRITALKQPQFNFATLSYAYPQGKTWTAEFKPQNVGFGLTYALPVVTTILRAHPGDLVIIENPESHLHPAGQSAIGKLCSIAAEAGVQFILETHSDHFLNGVRVAAKQRLIHSENIRVFYLDRDTDHQEHTTTVFQPTMNQEGRLDQWPAGFFDEWDKNLEQLL